MLIDGYITARKEKIAEFGTTELLDHWENVVPGTYAETVRADPFPDGALTPKPQKDCEFDFTTNKASFQIQMPKDSVPKQIYKRANKDQAIKFFF